MRRALALALSLAFVAGGCGGDDDSHAVRRALDRAADAPRLSATLRIDAKGIESVRYSISGAYDRPQQLLEADVDLGDDAAALAPGGRFELIGRGDRVYAHLPILSAAVGGRPWLGGEAADIAKRLGRGGGSLGAATVWPATLAEILTELAGAAKFERVQEGHYRGSFDLEALSGGEARDELGVDTLPAETWLDGEGRLSRLAIRLSGTRDGESWSLHAELETRGYGVPVEARVPAPAVTSDAAAILRRVKPFRIPASSMEPTLHCARPATGCLAAKEDKIVVDTRPREPRRGDIYAFKTPNITRDRCGAGGTFVKRIVGLPGETIEERLVGERGYMFVNGAAIPEPYVRRERRDGQTYGPLRLPAGRYFVMGDNRVQSCDSREWGPVRRSSLIGRLVLIGRNGRLLRPTR